MTIINNKALEVFSSSTAYNVKNKKEASSNLFVEQKLPNSETNNTTSFHYEQINIKNDKSARTNFFAQLLGDVYNQKQENQFLTETEKEFLDFMQKTPEERMWEMFLKQKGLSEESFAQLSQKEKNKIEEEFKEFIKQKIEQKTALDTAF